MLTRILRRNLIANIIPVIIIEALIIFMVIQLGLLPEYSYSRVNNINQTESLYEQGVQNIAFICEDELQYAGFDEVSGDERIGSYYYIFEGDDIKLLILTDETYGKIVDGEEPLIYATLEKDDMRLEYIENALAEYVDRGNDTFEGFVYPIVLFLPFVYAVFILQNHFSATLIIGSVTVVQMLVAGTRLRHFGILLAAEIM